MTKREGVPACEPVGEGWWCRLKERIDYLWDRASACILTVNHKTPDGDGDFAITGGDGIRITDEDNGVRIAATINGETVRDIVGQEAAARQQADAALQQDITTEETARKQADRTLQQALGAKADASALTAETQARQQADAALQSAVNGKASQTALDAETQAREQADAALQNGKLNKNQGTGNAGKVLVVGGDGIVKPGTSSASVAWGGISGELADQTDLSDALAGKADDTDVSALTTRVSSLETGTVKTTGSQSIAGSKTFTTDPTVAGPFASLLIDNSVYDKTTIPTESRYERVLFRDMNGAAVGAVGSWTGPDGKRRSSLRVYRDASDPNAGAWGEATLEVSYDIGTDTFSSSAPSIPGTSTDREIVNASSLNQWPSIVRTVGNQSIAGVKTFTQTPKAPTPAVSASDTEIVTAAWVRARIDEIQTPSIESLTYHGDSGTNTIRLDNVAKGDMISFDMGAGGSWVVPMIIVPALNPGDNYVLPNTGSRNVSLRLRVDSDGYYIESELSGMYASKITGSRIRLPGGTSTEATA